jgi:hypothetical protein
MFAQGSANERRAFRIDQVSRDGGLTPAGNLADL